MTRKRIEIRPGRILSIDITQDNPSQETTIFLFHGLGGRAEQWQDLKKNLVPHANIIAPDLLGHGDSEKPIGGHNYAFDAMYQDINALFNQFASKKNIIIAHSLSAIWISQLVLKKADDIDKLILISPSSAKPKRFAPTLYYFPSTWLDFVRNKLRNQLIKLVFTEKADPEVVKKEIAAAKKNVMEIIKSILYSTKDIPPLDVQKIPVRTLLIVAEKDFLVRKEESIKFYGKLPHLKIIEMKDVGHIPFLEKPAEINPLIVDFLFKK